MIQASVAALPIAPAGAAKATNPAAESPLFLDALGRALVGAGSAGELGPGKGGGLLGVLLAGNVAANPFPAGLAATLNSTDAAGEQAEADSDAFLLAMAPFMAQGDLLPAPVTAGKHTGTSAATPVGGKRLPLALADFAGRGGPAGDDSSLFDAKAGLDPSKVLMKDVGLAATLTENAALPRLLGAASGGLSGDQANLLAPGLAQGSTMTAPQAHPMLAAQAFPVSPDKVSLPMQAAFGAPGWQQEFADKLVWMTGRQGHVAELVLNPPSLGSVEVRLNLSGGEAGAQFYSPHASVRDAIEAALPRLRDLMAEAGLALGEAMVSNQPFHQRHSGQDKTESTASGQTGVGTPLSALDGAHQRHLGAGLVDFYA